MAFEEIQFDNDEAQDGADYLFGSRKRKKAAAENIQKTMDKLIASGQPLSDANAQALILASDGKISARDKKIIKQGARQTGLTDRTTARQEGRTDRTQVRQTEKTERTALETASVSGNPVTSPGQVMQLDPVSGADKAFIEGSGSAMPQALSGGFSAMMESGPEQAGFMPNVQPFEEEGAPGQVPGDPVNETEEKKFPIWAIAIVVAVAAFFIFKKQS